MANSSAGISCVGPLGFNLILSVPDCCSVFSLPSKQRQRPAPPRDYGSGASRPAELTMHGCRWRWHPCDLQGSFPSAAPGRIQAGEDLDGPPSPIGRWRGQTMGVTLRRLVTPHKSTSARTDAPLNADRAKTNCHCAIPELHGAEGSSMSGSGPQAAISRASSRMMMVEPVTRIPADSRLDSARENDSRVMPSSEAMRFFS